MLLRKTITSLAIGALAVTQAAAVEKLNGAGASFPATVYYDWAYTYQKDTKTQINYQSIGSGGGIKQIRARTVDFGASDKPLKPKKLQKYGLYQFPAVIGSIVLAYNLDGIKDGELKLSNDNVADIFLGKIKKWNDERIKANNPSVKLPDSKINLIRRSDGSGTTFNFTYYLSQTSDLWKSEVGHGKSVDWPVGTGAKGNEGVTNNLKITPNSLGYIEYSYKQKQGLKAATLQSASGKWVEATVANFKAAAAYAKWKPQDGFYELLTLQPGDTSYPIVAATFILIPDDKSKVEIAKKVTKFYDHAFNTGDKRAIELGYIPLPEETKNMIRKYWSDNGIAPKK